MTSTEEQDFIRKIFELAFGDGAVPESMALKETDPDYRLPFTYEEVVAEISEFERISAVICEMKDSDSAVIYERANL